MFPLCWEKNKLHIYICIYVYIYIYDPIKNNLCLQIEKSRKITSELSLGGERMGDLIFSHPYNSSLMNVYIWLFKGRRSKRRLGGSAPGVEWGQWEPGWVFSFVLADWQKWSTEASLIWAEQLKGRFWCPQSWRMSSVACLWVECQPCGWQSPTHHWSPWEAMWLTCWPAWPSSRYLGVRATGHLGFSFRWRGNSEIWQIRGGRG